MMRLERFMREDEAEDNGNENKREIEKLLVGWIHRKWMPIENKSANK